MLALADHAHEDGTGIRPSINRLVWKTGYSERSVQNILSQLRQLGILAIAVPATHNTPNEYNFNWGGGGGVSGYSKTYFRRLHSSKEGAKR